MQNNSPFQPPRRRTDWRRKAPAFTLVEMLVVIAIIGLLAAILLPVFGIAKAHARKSSCTNQLHQFAIAIETYRGAYGSGADSYPPWSSVLYPVYIAEEKLFVCPNDPSRGNEGGTPDWFSKQGACQYLEIDDTKARDDELATGAAPNASGAFAALERQARQSRNTAILANSYTYEFAPSPCSWWYGYRAPGLYGGLYDTTRNSPDKTWADFDRNGFVSWFEAKVTEQKGMVYDSTPSNTRHFKTDKDLICGGRVPIMRCFWHANEGKSLASEIALNLACENKNIYDSLVLDWKQAR